MSLAGDFNGFYAFLLQLEKLPRITRVTQHERWRRSTTGTARCRRR